MRAKWNIFKDQILAAGYTEEQFFNHEVPYYLTLVPGGKEADEHYEALNAAAEDALREPEPVSELEYDAADDALRI